MNRFPLWKNIVIALVLVLGFIYALPNYFGEAPAVQVSPTKTSVKLSVATVETIDQALRAEGLPPETLVLENGSIRARFSTTEAQIKARDLIDRILNARRSSDGDPGFVVALNLVSRSPNWLHQLHAYPMYLGLDLRGGVHFLMQVDMQAALTKRMDTLVGDVRTHLREKNLRHQGISREGQTLVVSLTDASAAEKVKQTLQAQFQDFSVSSVSLGAESKVELGLKPSAARLVQEMALKQNINTLNNRINELGVAEPIIQQQGLERILIQLPGVQDTAKAKDILGRTATLEVRMVDESTQGRAAESGNGPVPLGSERYLDRSGMPVIVKKQVVLTGDNLNDAQPGFDGQTQEPVVNLALDGKGARIFKDVTRENVGKRMAILLFEKGRGEVVTAPVIRSEIAGGQVQISGRMSIDEANDTALLLRAGALAAPMEIIEERTIGPSLGVENIQMGFNSVMWGLLAIVVFMSVYYMLFGVFSSMALAVNLLLLVAVLSLLQATLTLPGIAAMALALGMAIDSNVLINERVREELRNGVSPQSAIHAGYDRAWATIFDSNITTLIAGVALLAFGSGPVRGFAVVHCLGILTSMFSAVLFSRAVVNLWYGRQKRLKSISVGTVWKPDAMTSTHV